MRLGACLLLLAVCASAAGQEVTKESLLESLRAGTAGQVQRGKDAESAARGAVAKWISETASHCKRNLADVKRGKLSLEIKGVETSEGQYIFRNEKTRNDTAKAIRDNIKILDEAAAGLEKTGPKGTAALLAAVKYEILLVTDEYPVPDWRPLVIEWEAAKTKLAFYSSPGYRPWFIPTNVKKGAAGIISYQKGTCEPKVLQVIDATNMLVILRHPLNKQEVWLWIDGLPTDGLADGSDLKTNQLFGCTGTRTYDAVAGGSKTVFVLQPLDEKK